MHPSNPSLSIVIPAYNEAERLPPNLVRLEKYLAALPTYNDSYEVLVMVEKGKDDTAARCRDTIVGWAAFKIIENSVHRGKGYAVRSGMQRATGAIRFFMDADLSTPLEEIERFLKYLEAHPETDILIGNRRHASSHIALRQGWIRRQLSGCFNILVRRGLLSGIRDTQCGFKAFRAEAAREIFARQHLDGFAFDVEILLLAAAMRLKVVDLPVEWSDTPASTLRVLRDGWAMLRDVAGMRRRVARALREQPFSGRIPEE